MTPVNKSRLYRSTSKRNRVQLTSAISTLYSPKTKASIRCEDTDVEDVGSAYNSPERSTQWSAHMPSPPSISVTLADVWGGMDTAPSSPTRKAVRARAYTDVTNMKVFVGHTRLDVGKEWRTRWRARIRQWRAEGIVPIWAKVALCVIVFCPGVQLLSRRSRHVDKERELEVLFSDQTLSPANDSYMEAVHSPPRRRHHHLAIAATHTAPIDIPNIHPNMSEAYFHPGPDNTNASSPITALIESAHTKWESTLAKQSRTLEEAVNEYQSRYKQNPPKGFDKWWQYVM
jgi:hypothetical protein